MEDIISAIEKKCHEKLMIYHDLLNIFRKEKKSIVDGDVTVLWRFSSEKNKKAKKIEQIRDSILNILEFAEIKHGIDDKTFELEKVIGLFSGSDLRYLTESMIVINRVKKQIHIAGKANLLFIQEYLATINDLVDVVFGNTCNTALYNSKKGFSKNRDNKTVLISREV